MIRAFISIILLSFRLLSLPGNRNTQGGSFDSEAMALRSFFFPHFLLHLVPPYRAAGFDRVYLALHDLEGNRKNERILILNWLRQAVAILRDEGWEAYSMVPEFQGKYPHTIIGDPMEMPFKDSVFRFILADKFWGKLEEIKEALPATKEYRYFMLASFLYSALQDNGILIFSPWKDALFHLALLEVGFHYAGLKYGLDIYTKIPFHNSDGFFKRIRQRMYLVKRLVKGAA